MESNSFYCCWVLRFPTTRLSEGFWKAKRDFYYVYIGVICYTFLCAYPFSLQLELEIQELGDQQDSTRAWWLV